MSVSFNGSEQQQGSIIAPILFAAATAGIGAGAGAFVKEKVTAEGLTQMRADCFQKIIDNAPENSKGILEQLQAALKTLHPDAITADAKKFMHNAKNISLKTFMKRAFLGQKVTIERLNKELEKAGEEAKVLEAKVSDAEKALETAKNKEKAQKVIDKAKKALEEHQIDTENAKSVKNVAETAGKKGKISLEKIEELFKKMNLDYINARLRGMGKDIPKIISSRNALIGAAAGALVGGIGYLLFGGKKD